MFPFSNDFDTLSDGKTTLKICEKYPGDSDLLPFYYYDIFSADSSRIGKISIRIGDNAHSYYNGHIGYEISANHRGNGYALRACNLVLTVAKYHNMARLYLTCEISNAASRRVIEKLGGRFLQTVAIPKTCFFWREGITDYHIFSLSLTTS